MNAKLSASKSMLKQSGLNPSTTSGITVNKGIYFISLNMSKNSSKSMGTQGSNLVFL